jgi:hypothetical protein
MTVATMTFVAVATSPADIVRLVVIGLGALAAVASLAFARLALREIERLTERTARLESRGPEEQVTSGEQPRLLR